MLVDDAMFELASVDDLETRALFALQRMVSELRAAPEPTRSLLDAALAGLAKEVGADRVLLVVFRPEEGLARVEASFGLTADERRRACYALGQDLVGRVIEQAHALVQDAEPAETAQLTHARNEPVRGRARRAAWPKPGSSKPCLCVPLLHRKHGAIGALGWERERGRDLWPRRDLEVLASAAALLCESVTYLRERDSARAERERDELRERRGSAHGSLGSARGASLVALAPKSREMLALLKQVARSNMPVLISGETGSGKTLLARTLHELSAPAHAPLIELSCDALSGSQSAEGAEAWFSRARGGTLLLEQVGDLSAEQQADLVRVLQVRATDEAKLGAPTRGNETRLACTTSRDLRSTVLAGRFREDLYYRLRAFPIGVPPLRERRADLETLCDQLLRKHAATHQRPRLTLAPSALSALVAYDWPGNAQELDNVLARAVLATQSKVVEVSALPPELRAKTASVELSAATLDEHMARFERRVLLDALRDAQGRKAAAARSLQLTPRAFAYRLERLGLARK